MATLHLLMNSDVLVDCPLISSTYDCSLPYSHTGRRHFNLGHYDFIEMTDTRVQLNSVSHTRDTQAGKLA